MGSFGVHGQTGFGVSAMTVEAESAGNVERKNYAVALLDALYGLSDFLDDAHDFVANHGPFFERSAPVVHVQIAAANAAGGAPQDGIGWSFNFGFRMIVYRHFVSAFKTNCFHDCLQKSISSRMPMRKSGMAEGLAF